MMTKSALATDATPNDRVKARSRRFIPLTSEGTRHALVKKFDLPFNCDSRPDGPQPERPTRPVPAAVPGCPGIASGCEVIVSSAPAPGYNRRHLNDIRERGW